VAIFVELSVPGVTVVAVHTPVNAAEVAERAKNLPFLGLAAPIGAPSIVPPVIVGLAIWLTVATSVETVPSATPVILLLLICNAPVIGELPSVATEPVNAVAISDRVVFAHVDVMVVPVVTGFPAGRV
jgi:hypothetical protein